MEKTVFLVNPPVENATKYLLILYRSGGSFGGGRPTVIGVDRLERVYAPTEEAPLVSYEGYAGDALVVAFPSENNYLLLTSSTITQATPAEAAQRQKDEDDAVDAILGKPTPPAGFALPHDNDGSGQYL